MLQQESRLKKLAQYILANSAVSSQLAAHFSKLKKDVRLRMYELYKMDFEMFGYDASEFL